MRSFCYHIAIPGHLIRIDEWRITVYKYKGGTPLVHKRIYYH